MPWIKLRHLQDLPVCSVFLRGIILHCWSCRDLEKERRKRGAVHTATDELCVCMCVCGGGGTSNGTGNDAWLAWGLLKFAVELVIVSLYHDLAFSFGNWIPPSSFFLMAAGRWESLLPWCAEMWVTHPPAGTVHPEGLGPPWFTWWFLVPRSPASQADTGTARPGGNLLELLSVVGSPPVYNVTSWLAGCGLELPLITARWGTIFGHLSLLKIANWP